jgi:Fic family protein
LDKVGWMFVQPPPSTDHIQDALLEGDRLTTVLLHSGDPEREAEYLHWDRLRHLPPPAGLTVEEWWWKIKFGRRDAARQIPLRDVDGARFSFTLPDAVLALLHFIDQRCAGEIAMSEVVTGDTQAREHYLVNSLMEEAIRSSQLEGATTSRRVAKELLRTDRAPRDRSERMIVNNFRALQFMRSIESELTPSHVLELQRILTEGTLDNPDAAGRLQRPDEDRVAVFDTNGEDVLHRPPPAFELPGRLQAMCDFANADSPDVPFVHPVIRGVLLHFWLAYDHPFEDGNGRTARALFYWYMRTRGYWLIEYLSISRILRDSPAQYARAYLLTETDSGDTTYFLLQQLTVLQRAVVELHEYLQRKMTEIRHVESVISSAAGLNRRQLELISDALRHPERLYSYGGHARSHGVTHETARKDLSQLADRELLIRHQLGRQFHFTVPVDLGTRLEGL